MYSLALGRLTRKAPSAPRTLASGGILQLDRFLCFPVKSYGESL